MKPNRRFFFALHMCYPHQYSPWEALHRKTKKDEAEEEDEEEEEGKGGGRSEKKRKAGGTAKAGGKKKARKRGSGGEEAASAAQGSGAEEMTELDEKEMKRRLKEELLGKMTPEERKEWLEELRSRELP